MSDQDHLSAEYMHSKCVGLLSRCGDIAGQLQILLRLRSAFVTPEELTLMIGGMMDTPTLTHSLNDLRTSIQTRLSTKVSPDIILSDMVGLAPSSSLNLLEHAMSEIEILHENVMKEIQEKQEKMYQQALRRAGIIVGHANQQEEDGGGSNDDANEADGDTITNQPQQPSLLDTLNAVNGIDDAARMKLALAHILRTAPSEWNLAESLTDHREDRMHMQIAELSDLVTAERDRLARLEHKKDALAAAIRQFDISCDESPGDTARRRLDQLKHQLKAKSDNSVLRRARDTLQQMRDAQEEGKRLMKEYDLKNERLKKLCKSKGLDLEQMMMEEVRAETTDTTNDNTSSVAGSFLVGGASTPAFPVAFSTDGSGRLLPLNRSSDALTLLGFTPKDSEPPNPHSEFDEPTFTGSDDMLAWCRTQVVHLRRRMDTRFQTLQTKIDTWSQQRYEGRQILKQLREDMRQRLNTLQQLIREDSSRVEEYRRHVTQHLRQLAEATNRWKEKGQYYQKVHTDSLVLLQRMGEEVDSIVVV